MAISAWLKWPKLIVPDVNTTAAPIIDYISLRVEHQSVEELWTEQPHLRTVVDFLARNIAQLGLQAFERQDDGGRERVRDSPLSTLLRRPSPQQTGYELVRALVSDLALYDNAYLMILRRSNTEPGAPNVELRTIRPSWITVTEILNVGTYPKEEIISLCYEWSNKTPYAYAEYNYFQDAQNYVGGRLKDF